jgi:hypothetical protein
MSTLGRLCGNVPLSHTFLLDILVYRMIGLRISALTSPVVSFQFSLKVRKIYGEALHNVVGMNRVS